MWKKSFEGSCNYGIFIKIYISFFNGSSKPAQTVIKNMEQFIIDPFVECLKSEKKQYNVNNCIKCFSNEKYMSESFINYLFLLDIFNNFTDEFKIYQTNEKEKIYNEFLS